MNYFRLVHLFLRRTSTCLEIATVIDIAVMVPECRPLLPRHSMIPHPPTIAPSWQDPICRLPYHLISVSGHDTPNTILCPKARKDYHKDCYICTLIWAGSWFEFSYPCYPCLPCACDNLQTPPPTDLHSSTYFAAECLALTVQPPRLNNPHYTRTTPQTIPILT